VAVSQTITGMGIVLGATIATWLYPGWGLLWGWIIWSNAAVLIAHIFDGVCYLLGSSMRLSPVLYGCLAVFGGTPMGWMMNQLLRRPGPTGIAQMLYHALLIVQGILLALAVTYSLILGR
jgi:hypothetical protein